MIKRPIALTIAGSDPSGGAGIQADLKTFHQRKVYGMAVLTLLTVQNTKGVKAVHVLKPRQVIEQIKTVLEDIRPAAAKTGALGSTGVIRALAREARFFKFPLVVDPVMISKHGAPLLPKSSVLALRDHLLPHAALITPNVPEAEILSGTKIRNIHDMEIAARLLLKAGARAALIKGGHLRGPATDVLADPRGIFILRSKRIKTRHTHGTGCTYSAAITAELAKGKELREAVQAAKKFILEAIRSAPGVGRGMGPVNHFAEV